MKRIILFCIFSIFLQFQSGSALDCYQCSSTRDFYCNDETFDVGAVDIKSCEIFPADKPRSEYVIGEIEGPACVRFDGYDDTGKRFTVRGCSPYGKPSCDAVKRAAIAENSKVEYCETCTTAKCNSGVRVDTQKQKAVGTFDTIKNYVQRLFK